MATLDKSNQAAKALAVKDKFDKLMAELTDRKPFLMRSKKARRWMAQNDPVIMLSKYMRDNLNTFAEEVGIDGDS